MNPPTFTTELNCYHIVTSLITRSGCNKNERGTDDKYIIVPVFDLSCSGGAEYTLRYGRTDAPEGYELRRCCEHDELTAEEFIYNFFRLTWNVLPCPRQRTDRKYRRCCHRFAHIAVLLPMAVKSDQYGIRNLNLSAFDIYDTHVAA